MKRFLVLAAVLLAPLSATSAFAQAPKAQTIQSHQINADGSVTFRYLAPAAKSVAVALDIYAKPLAMTLGAAACGL